MKKMKNDPLRRPQLPKTLVAASGPEALSCDGEAEAMAFVGTDFTATTAEHLFVRECMLGGCRFAGCSVRNSHFVDVLFRGCDFAAADLRGCSWQRVAFVDCRLSGADLSGAAMRDVVFERPKAEGMSLFGSRLRGVRFEQGALREAAFDECRVERLEFERCDLTRAAFFGTRLRGVSLAGSEIGGLRVTTIVSPELQGVRIDRTQALDLAALLGAEVEEVP